MEHISIDDIESAPYDDLHTGRRDLATALGTDHLAITHYVLESGERFSGSVHAHMDQEEVFVVLEGEVTFEVARVGGEQDEQNEQNGLDEHDKYDRQDVKDGQNGRELTVAEREAIRFAPGEFQSGRNDGDERVVALALGAPRDSDDVRITRIPVLDDRDVSCPDCDHDHLRIGREAEAELVCPECGTGVEIEDHD
ncbi:cupin [Natrialba sp. SSL1]|uniref:cupin n=1 Tax=Natrialba sp. SSL1 TaxID=1869245 RepID=UPI0008F961EE|nr:cupin [Natrialba sp. SSL1]OIB58364.1 cupin [Natrialba sp. SSL1]